MKIRITECPDGLNRVEAGVDLYVAVYSRRSKKSARGIKIGRIEPFASGKIRVDGLRRLPGSKAFYASIDGYKVPYRIIDAKFHPVVAGPRQDTICLSLVPKTVNGWVLETTEEMRPTLSPEYAALTAEELNRFARKAWKHYRTTP